MQQKSTAFYTLAHGIEDPAALQPSLEFVAKWCAFYLTGTGESRSEAGETSHCRPRAAKSKKPRFLLKNT